MHYKENVLRFQGGSPRLRDLHYLAGEELDDRGQRDSGMKPADNAIVGHVSILPFRARDCSISREPPHPYPHGATTPRRGLAEPTSPAHVVVTSDIMKKSFSATC
jgi:hypothetical protein